MEKFSYPKSYEEEENTIQQAKENSLNNLDLISAEDTLRKIQKSPAISEIPLNTEKSPSVKDTNSMNNTANNKFFNARQEIINDSALSSFHIHNINNQKEKEILKIPNSIKEKTIKIPKRENNKSNLSNTNQNVSRDSKASKKGVQHSFKEKSEKESLHSSYSDNIDHKTNNNPSKKKSSLYQEETNQLKKKIQINSLSLSISKDKEMESDNEYRDDDYNKYNQGVQIQNNLTEKSLTKETGDVDNDIYNNNLNDFSKSGTFKSQSAANYDSKVSYSNNVTPDYHNYTDNPSLNNNLNYAQTKSDYNVNNKMNRYTTSNYSNSNFYKEAGKNFSETISDLQSLRNENRNNQSSYITDRKNLNENGTMSNFNLNNSTINEMIKKDLYEYLSNLENKQIVKLNKDKKNEWVVQFNADADEEISLKEEDQENVEAEGNAIESKRCSQDNYKINSYNTNNHTYKSISNSNMNSYSNSQPSNILKRNNSVNIDKKIINQRKEYTELRNQVEILKKEKQGIENFLKNKAKANLQIMNKMSLCSSDKKNMNLKGIPTSIIQPTKTNNTSCIKSNKDYNTIPNKQTEETMKNDDYYSNNSTLNLNKHNDKNYNKNMNYISTSKIARDNLNLKQYESEVLDKIKNDDMFSEVSENYTKTHDHLGDFIDRVIERSLYIYKNKNCHTCSKLLSTGKSTRLCPKNH